MVKIKWRAGAALSDRWTLEDSVVDAHSGRPLNHVWFANRDDGIAGVAKKRRDHSEVHRLRFENEIRTLQRLDGVAGVVRLLDSSSDDPGEWFVTERGVLLGQHHAAPANVRDVVSSFVELSHTLHTLQGTYGLSHRDLKPANLFYVNGRATLGDFGLVATQGTGESPTVTGLPIGSVNFLAPEAREWHNALNPFACDVYSLAVCLWSISADGRLPPPGTLDARQSYCSLYPYGGKSTDMLARLLERCTAYRPVERPSMRDLHEELQTWLDMVPPEGAKRPNTPHAFRTWGAMREASIYTQGPFATGQACVKDLLYRVNRRLATKLDDAQFVDAGLSELQEDYDWLSRGDPDWIPEWTAERLIVWPGPPSVRLIAVLLGTSPEQGCYAIEWQVETTRGSWEVGWSRTVEDVVLRMPSEWQVRDRLVADIVGATP